jgi:hypothetical protein
VIPLHTHWLAKIKYCLAMKFLLMKKKNVVWDVEKLKPKFRQRDYKMMQQLWQTVEYFFKMLITELSYDPAIPVLEISPR